MDPSHDELQWIWRCAPYNRVTLYTRACSAHSHSIVLAFCSPRGSHASPHYLLSPPVTAVCYYGDRPCTPLEGEAAVKGVRWEKSAWDDGQGRERKVKKGSVSDEGRNWGWRSQSEKEAEVKVGFYLHRKWDTATNIVLLGLFPLK